MKKILTEIKTKRIILIFIVVIFILMSMLFVFKDDRLFEDTAKSTNEKKLCSLLEKIEGVGQADVMISEEEDGISGVVIVCQGADNIVIRNNLLDAVSTALNIERQKIAIYSMKI